MMVPMPWHRLMTVTSLTLALTVGALGAAAANPVSPEQADARVTTKLSKRLSNPRIGGDVSVVVLDRDSGRLVFSSAADDLQLPASNMKVVTAVTALASMAPETRFTTRVLSTGTPNDLVLQGGGDPLLTRAMVRGLMDQSVASLDPALPVVLHADVSRFPAPKRPGGWPRAYVPSVASSVTPLAFYGDYRSDPTRVVMDTAIAHLTSAGFTVTRGADTVAPPDAPVIAEAVGRPLTDVIAVMLRDSENNIAEVLFRQVAIATGNAPTWDGSEAAATAVLANLGIDTTGSRLDDGSGLSRRNRVTALMLANVVRLSRTDPRFAPMYVDHAMPIAGRSGTLDDRYGRFTTKQSRCAAGLARAKTGTLFDTIGLSGVTPGADGTEKVFSILVNHRPKRFSPLATRQAVDGLVSTITGCW